MARIAITKVFVEPFLTLLMTAASAINSQSIMQKKINKKKQSRAEQRENTQSRPVHPATALFSNALPKLMSQANWSVIIATQELSRGSAPPPPLLFGLRGNQLNNWFQATPRKSRLWTLQHFFPPVLCICCYTFFFVATTLQQPACAGLWKKKPTRTTTTTTQSCCDVHTELGMHLAFSLGFQSQGHRIMDGLK